MSTDDTTPLLISTPGAGPETTTAPSAETTTPAPGSAATAAEPPTRLRVGTVVWGLVLALVGIGVAAIGAGAALDLQAALIGLLVVAGSALLVGAVVTARRSRRP